MSRQSFDPPQYGGGGMPQLMLPRLTPAVKLILIANAVVQLIQFISAGQLTELLGASADKIVTMPPYGLLCMFTSMWVHAYDRLGHLAFNMLALYFFGTMVEERIGTRRFLRLYVLCGLCGAVFWVVTSAIMGLAAVPAIGASGACYGVVAAAALLNPQARVIVILFPVRLWVVAAALGLFALYDTVIDLREGPQGGVANAAHLGGMVFALIWWRGASLFARLGGRLQAHADRRQRAQRAEQAKELDRLLAKINEVGMNGLSASERRFLRRYSKDR